MLKLNPHQQRSPLGGHHYPSHGRTFKEESFDKLVKSLKKFRVDNAIPVGDPAQDVLIFYAKHFPWMVMPDFGTEPKKDDSYEGWRDWITKTWQAAPTKFVSIKESEQRWKVCEKCPFNTTKGWAETDESAAFTKRAFMLRRGIPVPKFLGFCSCHRADLTVLVMLDEPKKCSAKKDGEQPQDCWVV